MPPRRRRTAATRSRVTAARRQPPWRWLRSLVPWGVGIALALATALGLRAFLLQAEYFTVRQVQVPQGLAMPLAHALLGQNLWSVDLATVQQTTALANPAFKLVRVWRQWPQRIVVEALPRTPVAQVHLNRYYPIDAEQFILADGSATPLPALTVLEGVDLRGARLVPGRANASERLTLALEALERLQAAAALRGHQLHLLDVSNPAQIVLLIDNGLEVRLGLLADWPRRLPQLQRSLEMLARKQLTPSYLDLRFDEDPIIGPPR